MIRARKRFGQHFLHDPGVLARIVAAIDPKPGERVVEIGPGRGALTFPLLERCKRLEVIEVDRDLARLLRERAAGTGELIVHEGDVLEVDFAGLHGGGPPLRVCGNLPYNISTPLLFHLLESRAAIADMHFMLQKEVVDRIVAPPGGKTYGRLTVMLAAACRAERLFQVGRGAFQPPPAVDSAVVRLVPHAGRLPGSLGLPASGRERGNVAHGRAVVSDRRHLPASPVRQREYGVLSLAC